MSEMDKTLKGVVRDHRLPQDYKYGHNQPMRSQAFRQQFWKWIRHRAISKQNITTPGYALVSHPSSHQSQRLTSSISPANLAILLLRLLYMGLLQHRQIPTRTPRRQVPLQKRQLRRPEPQQRQPRQPLGLTLPLLDD